MITTAVITAMALIMTLVSAKSSYPFFRFFAGALWWALGVWLLITPFVSGSSPINDIMVVLCFIGGFGVMLFMGWVSGENGGESSFRFRLPSFLGGMSAEEENAMRQRNAMGGRGRRADYRARANAAIRGRRVR